MAKRRKRDPEELAELNLAPIMNMVMILIPLLLLSTVFLQAGVINVSTPRNAQSTQAENEETPDEVPVPKVVVTISSDGFRVVNTNAMVVGFEPFAAPIEGCAGSGDAAMPANPHDAANAPPTICLRPGAAETDPLVERLDYASLYNRLVEIRLNPVWFEGLSQENNSVISLLADEEVPFEVLVKVMDTARYILNPGDAELSEPTATSGAGPYQLGGGQGRPTLEQLEDAKYIMVIDGDTRRYVSLFPDPVLLLARGSDG
jgi:biopolymer transport protein ExbD